MRMNDSIHCPGLVFKIQTIYGRICQRMRKHWVDFLVFLSYLCWSLVVLVGNFLDLGFLQQRGVVR